MRGIDWGLERENVRWGQADVIQSIIGIAEAEAVWEDRSKKKRKPATTEKAGKIEYVVKRFECQYHWFQIEVVEQKQIDNICE